MNCRECLEELSTASLRELPADSLVMQHCATCPDCARLTTLLRDREYDAATLLNNLPPISNPLSVAENSAAIDRRRRVGRVVVTLSGIGAAMIIALVSSTMIIPAMSRVGVFADSPPVSHLRTETIALSCLSPEQAGDIINPYVRSRGSTYYTIRSGISAITVRGTADEVARSRALIHDFESDPAAACHHPMSAAAAADLERAAKQLEDAFSVDVAPVIAGAKARAAATVAPDATPAQPKKE